MKLKLENSKIISWFVILLFVTLYIINASLLAESNKEGKKSMGETLYVSKCAACHGKDGKGVAKMATMLKSKIQDLSQMTLTKETQAQWRKVTIEGKGKMPAYKTKLKEAETDSVLAYIATFAKKEASADSAKGTKK